MQPSRSRRMTLSSIPEPTGSSRSARRKSVGVVGKDDARLPNQNQRTNTKKPPVPPSNIPSGPSARRKSMVPRPGRENAPPLPPKPIESFGNALSPSASSQVSHRSRMSFGSKRVHGTAQQADVRPTNDRKFVQKCIADLSKFLQDTDYHRKVSSKQLSQLSSNEIENITKHVFRLFDSDFQRRSPLKFIDEVVHGFRFLGYPYAISRTAWVSAQTTPIILALHWLGNHILAFLEEEPIDYLYTDLTFENFEELHDNTERAFYQYLKRAFTAFMKKNDPDTAGFELALMNRFQHDDMIVSNQTEHISEESAEILQDIEELQKNGEMLDEETKNYENWKEKIEKMKIVVNDMKEYRHKNEEKKLKDIGNLKDAEEALGLAKQQLEDLNRRIAEQTMSVDDVQKIEIQSKGYLESRQRFEESMKDQSSNLLKKQSELNQVESELEATIHEISTLAGTITFQGEGLFVRFSSETLEESTEDSIFGKNLRNSKETLMSLRANGESELQSSKHSIESALDEHNKKKVALKQANSRFENACSKVQYTKKSLIVCEERQDLRRKEMGTLKDDIDQASERESALQREIIALEAKMRRSSDDFALAIASKHRDIEISMDCMEDHLAYIDAVVVDVHEFYRSKMQVLRALQIRKDED